MNTHEKSEKNETLALKDHPFIFLMNQEFSVFEDFLSEQMDRLFLLDKALVGMGDVEGNYAPMDGGYQAMLLTSCKDMRKLIDDFYSQVDEQHNNLSHIDWQMDKEKAIEILAPYMRGRHGVRCSDGKVKFLEYEDMEYLLLNKDGYITEEISPHDEAIWQWWLQAYKEIQPSDDLISFLDNLKDNWKKRGDES